MKEKSYKSGTKKRVPLFFSIIIVFCIFGCVVFSVSQKISKEMSEAAVQNLNENLDLIKCTIEAIWGKEAEFQKLIAKELASIEDPEDYIRSYQKNQTMVKISLIKTGETEGISNTGEVFTEEGMEFFPSRMMEGVEISSSYLNYMGTWAYTLKCPVIKGDEEIGALYVEYTYDSLDKSLPDGFYDKQAMLYIMDAKTERFVLKPKGMGERNAGHLNLEDFYRANEIHEEPLRAEIEECLHNKEDIMFYHDIRGKSALNFIWMVNDGTICLTGYVPMEAIQQEGETVNNNIFIVIFVMTGAFFLCCILYYLNQRQQRKIMEEREAEREQHNKQLTEALHAAQLASNAKTTFLSNMSHDIRTPMNAVIGFTTLLAKDAENPDKVREYTKKIMASGQHLLGLINDILEVSKIESGKLVLTEEEFALADLISSIDAIIRPMAGEKDQEFHVEITDIEHEYFIGDETRINQILINLLSNAVKYTQKGGNIWLRIIGLKQHSGQFERIRIEVEDDGYGMTQEYLKTIFDVFTRAENSTTNKVQGTGLGMAITKNIVELMGGTIEVFSEVDKGSLFRVEVELGISESRTEEQGKGKSPEAEEEGSLQGLNFLAAEDNEINAEILSEILASEGANCEILENGRLVLERFMESEKGEFDAILMDVQMPVMNGYEATRAIRQLPREDADTIPIIAMTANAFVEDEKEALKAGMNVHLAKPIDVGMLKKVINRYIKRNSKNQ